MNTSRIKGLRHRVQVPLPREKCHACKKLKAGVCSPFGGMRVCTSSACLYTAQLETGGKPGQKLLGPGKVPAKAWYCGAVVAYQGNDNWTVGMVFDTQLRKTEWFRNLTLPDALSIIGQNSHRIRRMSEQEILDTVGT